jgi:hypothetical protein
MTWGSGSINGYGYRTIRNPTHPLANTQGRVLEHRAVLYDAIGADDHPCHWCGKSVAWSASRQGQRICVDHLNHDRLDNSLPNLVVACLTCNSKRVKAARTHCRKGHEYTEATTRNNSQGQRSCLICYRATQARRDPQVARDRATAWYWANREYVLAKRKAAS